MDARPDDVPVIKDLGDLAALVRERKGLYGRFSRGPQQDRDETSRDYESGASLPGLSVNALDVEQWWERPVEDWLARKLCNYAHLMEEAPDERRAWVLTGREVARGPDNEPLVADAEPVALLDDNVVRQAKDRYHREFDVEADSTGDSGVGQFD
jgi:uncharacterized protein DUF6098